MFNQQPKHGVIWSKLLGEWSRLLGTPHLADQLRQQWLKSAELMPWFGVFPPGTKPSSASTRAGEALAAELGSQALGRWLHWVDASAWLAKDTLNYVQRLQLELARATQELHAESLDTNLR